MKPRLFLILFTLASTSSIVSCSPLKSRKSSSTDLYNYDDIEVSDKTDSSSRGDIQGRSADCMGGGGRMMRGGGGSSQPIIIVTGGSGASAPSSPPADSGGGTAADAGSRRRRARRRRARLVRMARKAARKSRTSG